MQPSNLLLVALIASNFLFSRSAWTDDFYPSDFITEIGSTGQTFPNCMSYGSTLCSMAGEKVLVQDAQDPGLVGFWKFDDSKSTDSSGFGNHPLSTVNFGPAMWGQGQSAWFNGVDMMEIPHSPDFETKDISITFWIYLTEDSSGSWRTVFRKGATPTELTPTISLFPKTRRIHARLCTTESVSTGLDSTAILPLRRWTHVAYQLQGQVLRLFVNGILDTEKVIRGDVLINNGPIYLGKDPYLPGTGMFLDEFKWYKRVLSEKEIALEADASLTAQGTEFVRLGCTSCTREVAQNQCGEIGDYHLCTSNELLSGGLIVARSMGWIRPSLDFWIKDPNNSPLSPLNSTSSDSKVAICCRD